MKVLSGFLILILSAVSQAETSIAVRAHTVVSSSHDIHLSDVIVRENIDKKMMGSLAAVKLTNGPRLGERRVLSSGSISRLLRQSLKNVPESGEVRLTIPNQVIVENLGHQLSRAEIEAELRQNWKSFCADCEFEITSLSLPKVEGRAEPIKWKIHFDSRAPRGQFSLAMQVEGEGTETTKHWVQGSVKVQKPVAVATRAIHFGEKLMEGDLEMKLQDITFSHDSAATTEIAIGQRVRRALRAGDIVWTNSLEKKMATRRGQVVKMVIGSEDWLLSMPGVAQMDGQIGDVISVKNTKTNKVVSAKITSDNEVRVE